MTRDKVRALIFDFGGVFTDSPFDAVETFGESLGLNADAVTAIVFGSYEQDGGHPWHQLERGEISLESARQEILSLGREQGLEVDIYDLFSRMAGNNAGVDRRQPLVDKVRSLKSRGYPMGIITNNVVEFGDAWRGLIPVDELFDFVVDSSHVGVRKPDPRIFQIALRELGSVDASSTVYLDDYPANVKAAETLGMRGITVTADMEATLEALDSLLET
jgi:epoxide hydrolase-like predicted phosphatase